MFCLVATPSFAQNGAGMLDPCGSFNPSVYNSSSLHNWGNALVKDNFGNSIQVGSAANIGSSYDFSVRVIFDDCGLDHFPDKAFGVDFGTGTGSYESYDWATSAAVDSQGRLIVAGYTSLANPSTGEFSQAGPSKFAVARLIEDIFGRLSLDSTFGSGGEVVTDFGSVGTNSGFAYAAAVDSSDRVIVAGATGGPTGSGSQFAVVRYNTDGSLDSTFGNDGIVLTNFQNVGINTTPTFDAATALAVDGLGRIVVAGYSYDQSSSIDSNGNTICTNGCPVQFALVRYNSDGSLDTTFGSSGKVVTSLSQSGTPSDSFVQALAIHSPTGNIVAAGYSDANSGTRCLQLVQCASDDFAVARYLPTGGLDGSFGNGGTVLTDFSGNADQAYGVAVDIRGRTLVAGTTSSNFGSNSSFGLARYLDNGALDGSFGSGGKVILNFGTSQFHAATFDQGHALAFDGLDKILVAGSSNGQMGIARFINENADLSITTSASATSVLAGNLVDFTSVVTNLGPDATLAEFENLLPLGFDFVSAVTTKGSCVQQELPSPGFETDCILGDLVPSEQVTILVTAQATETQTSVYTAKAIGNDPHIANNENQVDMTVSPAADLSVSMSGAPNPVSGGSNVTYTIIVTNDGPSPATGITLTDVLQNTYISSGASQGSCGTVKSKGNTTLNCALGNLDAGQTEAVALIVKAPNKKGTISNTATVSSQTADPIPADNSATATVTVK
jgi:uncharacterized delta-60 repeat protein/uncharacterized repeat protein (TIGR01451 family)